MTPDASPNQAGESGGEDDAPAQGVDSPDTTGRDWRSFARTWAHRVALVVLLVIVVPFVVYMVPQVVGADHSYVVTSGSMEPAIGTGDVILVSNVSPSQIGVGDVITFASGGDDRTTHRVIDVVEEDGQLAFQTKGDNNEDPDASPVSADQVEGKVVSLGGVALSIPFMGHVIVFANTPRGFLALFVLPVVLLVATEVWSVVSSSTEDETEGSDGASGPTAASDGGEARESSDSSPGAPEGGAAEAEAEDEQVTFSAAELELGLLVLAAFSAYSFWVAYVTMETWSFGIAGSTGVALLLLGGLYLKGRLSRSGPDTDAVAGEADSAGTTPDALSSVSTEGDDD